MFGALRANARWLVIGGLIILNIALITALVVRQSAGTVSAMPVSASTSGETLRPTPGATSVPTPSANQSTTPSQPADSSTPASAERPARTQPSNRLITANSDTMAWRADRGRCGQRARIEVTTDGGHTWRRIESGLRGVVRLQAYGDRSVFAVAADRSCRPTYASAQSPGHNWRQDPSVSSDTWFTAADDPARVHAPGGRADRPCGSSIRAFAATGAAGAAVICADGRVRTSTTGSSWHTVQRHSSAIALGSSDRGLLIAYPSASCDRLMIRQVSAVRNAEPTTTSCAGQLGAVAIAAHGATTWRWVGDQVSAG
ncbi:MAG TPA: hypothetical protein VFP34_17890 [Microlunatus sp.]|nr:hypothetical protein [Microlunatus sp.]